jgi:hypothetical protein
MNDELLFCKPWTHVTKKIHNKEIDICVSDIIYGNQQGTLAQYHAVIITNEKVARICDFSNKITKEMADEYIFSFEEGLRDIIRKNFTWELGESDNGTVKIWYYSGENLSSHVNNDKRFYPFFRCVITINNVICINKEKSQDITDQLRNYIFNWLDKVTAI